MTVYKLRLAPFIATLLFTLSMGCKEEEVSDAVLLSISPKNGQPETIVKIRGKHFSKTPNENRVSFNGISAVVISASDSVLEVKAPVVESSGPIELSVRNQKIIGPNFQYYSLYCFGGKDQSPAYWKDGKSTLFSGGGYIYDMVTSGNDTHAVGFSNDNTSTFIPRYWKNGEVVPIEGLTNEMKLTAITISGQDVYICGIKYGPSPAYYTARYWKNGKLTFSTQEYAYASAKATDIEVVGGDVYMIGSEYPKAMIWKNGIPTDINASIGAGEATKIRTFGNDIHIMGYYVYGQLNNRTFHWKNGLATVLREGAAIDFAITQSNTYVTGYGFVNNGVVTSKTFAKLWKDNEEFTLSNGGTRRYGAAMEVIGNDVYVLTNEFGQGSYPYYSILTRNSVDVTPDYGPGVSGSISGFNIKFY